MNIKKNSQKTLTTSLFRHETEGVLATYTIGNAVFTAASRHQKKVALLSEASEGEANKREWSYADVAVDAQRVAHALLRLFEKGDHVAIWATNSPEWVLFEFAASLAGLTIVTVNPAYLADELLHVLEQSDAKGIFVQDHYRGRNLCDVVNDVKDKLPMLQHVVPLSTWDTFTDVLSADLLPNVEPSDMAQIQYTSGTTGFPKGACLSHNGLVNNARIFAETIGATSADIWINPMPMFHTAGCGLATLGALQTGGKHIITPAFDPNLVLDLFEQERATIVLCVPTMLVRLLDEQERQSRDVSSCRLICMGGAPVPSDLVKRAERLMGANVVIGFGQTETSPYITHTLPDDPNPAWPETVGVPMPFTDVKIVDKSTGKTLPINQPGEICAKGYNLMLGYYKNPVATADTIDGSGWLHTGDVGSMDKHGYCRISGRLKDMIIRGGENIYPKEVEDVLFSHPAVNSVSVLGLPDAEWGEKVVACIILKAGQAVNAATLELFSRDSLASYKVPRDYLFLDDFPQTASGKIQKFALKAIALERGV